MVIWLEDKDAALLILAIRRLIQVQRDLPSPNLLHVLFKLENKVAEADKLTQEILKQ